MKLLKLILITCIFLQLLCTAAAKNTVQLKVSHSITDTVRHIKKRKRKIPYPPPPESPIPTSDEDCVFVKKYTAAQRLKKYPFSKAAKIVAVSYEWALEDSIDAPKRPDTVFISDLHIKHGRLNYSSLKEIKQLDAKEINQLTNIIYNTDYKKDMNSISPGHECFSPRNALLFYNKNGKIFDYIEICFECEMYQSLSEKLHIGTLCNQKFDMIKQFFIDAGIKYGTTNTR